MVYSEQEQWIIAEKFARERPYQIGLLPQEIRDKARILQGQVYPWDYIKAVQRAEQQRKAQEPQYTPAPIEDIKQQSIATKSDIKQQSIAKQQDLQKQRIMTPAPANLYQTQTLLTAAEYNRIQDLRMQAYYNPEFVASESVKARGATRAGGVVFVTPIEYERAVKTGYSNVVPVASGPQDALQKGVIYSQLKGVQYAPQSPFGTETKQSTGLRETNLALIGTFEKQLNIPMTYSDKGLREVYKGERDKARASFKMLSPEIQRGLRYGDISAGTMQFGLELAKFNADILLAATTMGASNYKLKYGGTLGEIYNIPLGREGKIVKYSEYGGVVAYSLGAVGVGIKTAGVSATASDVISGFSIFHVPRGVYVSSAIKETPDLDIKKAGNLMKYSDATGNIKGYTLIDKKGYAAGLTQRDIPALKVGAFGKMEVGNIKQQIVYGSYSTAVKGAKGAIIYKGNLIDAGFPTDVVGQSAQAYTAKTDVFSVKSVSVGYKSPIVSVAKNVKGNQEFAAGMFKGDMNIKPEVMGRIRQEQIGSKFIDLNNFNFPKGRVITKVKPIAQSAVVTAPIDLPAQTQTKVIPLAFVNEQPANIVRYRPTKKIVIPKTEQIQSPVVNTEVKQTSDVTGRSGITARSSNVVFPVVSAANDFTNIEEERQINKLGINLNSQTSQRARQAQRQAAVNPNIPDFEIPRFNADYNINMTIPGLPLPLFDLGKGKGNRERGKRARGRGINKFKYTPTLVGLYSGGKEKKVKNIYSGFEIRKPRKKQKGINLI